MLETHENNSKRKLVITILSVLVIAGSVVFADYLTSKTTVAGNTKVPTTTTIAPSSVSNTNTATTINSSSATTTGYTDGTYSATSSYYVPHGQETIAVSLTVSGGAVTDVSIQNSESDHDSARYQQDFTAEYKSYVVGKKISGLKLSIISGASDTTQGFNDALTKIASEAQA